MKKAQAKNVGQTNSKDVGAMIDQKNHENPRTQSAQGNKENNAKLNAHRQLRQQGQRASGNKGQDAKNGN